MNSFFFASLRVLSPVFLFVLVTASILCGSDGNPATQDVCEKAAPVVHTDSMPISKVVVSKDSTLQVIAPDRKRPDSTSFPAQPDPLSEYVLELSESSEHVFIRQVPDMKVLFRPGIPITSTMDLRGTYDKWDDFQGTKPQLRLIQKGNDSVVHAELDGDILKLQWKSIGTSEIMIRAVNPFSGKVFDDRIRLECWTLNYMAMFFSVLGGLGIFLIGMKYMSDGLQMIAGPSLRQMIATITDNRFAAVVVGFFVTFLVQSSSVSTVMVVGFINSQIMTLSQGIGVIMGANIGTTVTGWLLTLNIGKYGLPIVGAAAFIFVLTKVERSRLIAMAVMGLGFVFFGLDLMQLGFVPLRDLPAFSAWMESFSADSYFGVMLCVGVGCVLTCIVQSSAATLGITISLAAIGVIKFETAAALVLGENIGTTITAFLASIGSTPNARKAAYFHVLFNTIGVLWITAIFRWPFLQIVKEIVGINPETGLIRDPKIGIALTHTLFNVANVIVFFPFTGWVAKFLNRVVPDAGGPIEETSRLTTLGMHHLETPAMAIERSRIEVQRMGNICGQLAEKVRQIIHSETPDQDMVDNSFHQEVVLDRLQDEIIAYTSAMLSGNISHDIADGARQQLRMADELESISDYLIVILKSDLKMRESDLSIPEPQKSDILDLHTSIKSYIEMIVQFYAARKSGGELITEVHSHGRSITRKVKAIRDSFIKRMSDEPFDPQVVIAINSQLNAYRRVREHAQNVAEAIVGVK